MIDIPHRFVPSMIKFLQPVTIALQTGHGAAIHSMAFCPLGLHLASLDTDRWLKVWKLETMDLLSTLRVSHLGTVSWSNEVSVELTSTEHATESFPLADSPTPTPPQTDVANTLYLLDSLSVTSQSGVLHITLGEETWEYSAPEHFAHRVDPVERFVAIANPQNIEILDVHTQETLFSLASQDNSPWVNLWLSSRGDLVLAFSEAGKIYAFDPMRPKPVCIIQMQENFATFCAYNDSLLAVANNVGNILIYDLQNRCAIFKTARKLPPFKILFPSPQKLGFIALRDESASAYLCGSQEIQPASPLPAPLACACAGDLYAEILIAPHDNKIYRLKLDSNDIEILTSLPQTPRILAYSAGMSIAYLPDLGFVFFDGEQNIKLKIDTPPEPSALALHEKGKYFASYQDQRLAVYNIPHHELTADLLLDGAVALLFGRAKSADSLYVLDRDLLVWRYDLQSHEITSFADLSTLVPNAIPITMVSAERGFAHILLHGAQEHYFIIKLGLNSAKCSISMRVLCIGQQIAGALFDDNRLYLRENAPNLRIIQNMQSFIPGDWSRSEPLAIF